MIVLFIDHKVSLSIYNNTNIIQGRTVIVEQWIELRNHAILEVDYAEKKLPETHPKQLEYLKKLNNYRTYFERLPLERPVDEKVQEVKDKLEELKQLEKEFEMVWIDLDENCYICSEGDAILNGEYTLYKDKSYDHPFGSCVFKNNKRCGIWKEEDENKRILLEIEYEEDKKIKSKYYYPDGSIKQLRYYKNDYRERVISFYNKSRIEYLSYKTSHSSLKIFYYERGIIKHIVLKRFSSKKENNKNTSDDDDNKKKVYEFNKDGYLLYEGNFVTKRNQENKRVINYYHSGNGCLFFYNAGYIIGTFEAACDNETGMNSPKNDIVKVIDNNNTTRTYKLSDLFKDIKVDSNNDEFVKDYDTWNKSKINEEHTIVKVNNSKHIVNKSVHLENDNDKKETDYMIHYGLCNCGINVLNVKKNDYFILFLENIFVVR